MARLFVAEGASVVLNSDRDDEAAAAIRAELGEARGLIVQGDVADPAAMEALTAQAVARFGRIDILVNNAGINGFTDPLQMTPAQWQRCFAVDLEGAWNAIRACLPGMLEQGAGTSSTSHRCMATLTGRRFDPLKGFGDGRLAAFEDHQIGSGNRDETLAGLARHQAACRGRTPPELISRPSLPDGRMRCPAPGFASPVC